MGTYNRGVQKTKKAFRDGLAEMMEEKDIEDITVKELSERVGLCRGTFYYHYEDIYSLQHSVVAELFSEIDTLMKFHTPTGKIADLENFFRVLLVFISDNAQIIKTFLSGPNKVYFVNEIKARMLENWHFDQWAFDSDGDPEEAAYYIHFLISGYLAILSFWLESNLSTPLEKISNIMSKLGMNLIELLDELKK